MGCVGHELALSNDKIPQLFSAHPVIKFFVSSRLPLPTAMTHASNHSGHTSFRLVPHLAPQQAYAINGRPGDINH